jgi:hypothetical protein
MPFSLLLISRLGVVNDGDKPISILPEIEHHVRVDIVGIREHVPNLRKVVPSDGFDDRYPGSDFARRIRIALSGFVQMPSSDDVHRFDITSQIVK